MQPHNFFTWTSISFLVIIQTGLVKLVVQTISIPYFNYIANSKKYHVPLSHIHINKSISCPCAVDCGINTLHNTIYTDISWKHWVNSNCVQLGQSLRNPYRLQPFQRKATKLGQISPGDLTYKLLNMYEFMSHITA